MLGDQHSRLESHQKQDGGPVVAASPSGLSTELLQEHAVDQQGAYLFLTLAPFEWTLPRVTPTWV